MKYGCNIDPDREVMSNHVVDNVLFQKMDGKAVLPPVAGSRHAGTDRAHRRRERGKPPHGFEQPVLIRPQPL